MPPLESLIFFLGSWSLYNGFVKSEMSVDVSVYRTKKKGGGFTRPERGNRNKGEGGGEGREDALAPAQITG